MKGLNLIWLSLSAAILALCNTLLAPRLLQKQVFPYLPTHLIITSDIFIATTPSNKAAFAMLC